MIKCVYSFRRTFEQIEGSSHATFSIFGDRWKGNLISKQYMLLFINKNDVRFTYTIINANILFIGMLG